MRVVGTAPLGAARAPGAATVSRVGDVVGPVRAGVGAVVGILARAATAVLRRPGLPAAAGKITGARLVMEAAGLAPSRRPPVREHTADAPVRSHELTVPADATAPRQARALLAAAALEWGLDDELHQDAAMVVTELVANAVDHARTPGTLTVGLDAEGLRIAVRDTCRCPAPRPRPVDPAAPRGRGLQMIDALASSWGVTGHVDGKTVWAVLPVP